MSHWTPSYSDHRPSATKRLEAIDHGIVLKHGDGPGRSDAYGARDVWVWEHQGSYFMHYDAAGDTGWLCALATSTDGLHWTKHGPVLELGAPGSEDSQSASYGVTFHDGADWHLFYLGTPNTSPAPDRIPAFPYLTMKARASSPGGPWHKQSDVVPFRPKPGTYFEDTASPGHVIKHGAEYLQFFSTSVTLAGTIKRTIGIARTGDLNGPWTVDPAPIVPIEEQIENSSLYFEPNIQTWFLFTNHIGIDQTLGETNDPNGAGGEYTDAIWVYWSKDLNAWDTANKAVVLDRNNCHWSPRVVGLPSVLPIGGRLAIYYDGLAVDDTSHMGRDVGLAWLELPLRLPD